MTIRTFCLALAVTLYGGPCLSNPVPDPLDQSGRGNIFLKKRGPLINVVQRSIDQTMNTPSLFIDQQASSLFAPYPARQQPIRASLASTSQNTKIARLRQLISQAESHKKGYDAVQHGARVRPAKTPTQMTLGEVFDWIKATPGQPHAIGRYQFIPKTLRKLVRESDLPSNTVFSAQVQDQLADLLLKDAGLPAFRDGQITRRAFMHNLAKIWAGLPTSTGRSYYHGFAGNKASITWAKFDSEMAAIFPS